jgi:protein TonB
MPSTLFDQTLAPRRPHGRPFGTVALSIVLHAAVLAAVLAWQFTGASDTPAIAAALPAFLAPPPVPPPLPPEPQQMPPAPTIDVNAAPTVPPEHITDEPVVIARPTHVSPSGALAVGSAGLPGNGTQAAPAVTLSGAPPPARTVVRPGGDIQAPARTVYVPPVYPEAARSARIEGEVIVEATIDEAGVVGDVRVLRSRPLLDRAAVEAVSQWRYTPTRLNGSAVSVLLVITVRFTLRQQRDPRGAPFALCFAA